MNKLYLCDNLTILKGLPDAFVDLIATDPPFNTGRDWGAFNDRWEGGMTGYLKFMEVRLIEMHRVLKTTGSIYLHCDPTAGHYLKVLLDGIFGIKNFKREIIWNTPILSGFKARVGNRNYVRGHDTILFYVKSSSYTWNAPRQPHRKEYLDKFKKTDASGRKYFDVSGKRSGNRQYLDKVIAAGRAVGDVWSDIVSLQQAPRSKERLGYPTQKPLALLDRIIKTSSNEGDLVLDPFAGSGTTLVASQSLNRRWIGIEQNPEAVVMIEKRVRDQAYEVLYQ